MDRNWVSNETEGRMKEQPLAHCTLNCRINTRTQTSSTRHYVHLNPHTRRHNTRLPQGFLEREILTWVDEFRIWGRAGPRDECIFRILR